MTVYVVTAKEPYGNGKTYVVGVAETKDKAKLIVQQHERYGYYDMDYDEFDVE